MKGTPQDCSEERDSETETNYTRFETARYIYSDVKQNARLFEGINWIDKLIAFTWSPDPQRFHSKNVKCQWRQMIGAGLRGLFRCAKHICVVPEITIDGRLHCHGWFILHDKVKWFREILPRMKGWGFVCIKLKVDKEWLEYCIKDLEITAEIIDVCVPYCNNTKDEYDIKVRKIRKALKDVKVKPRTSIVQYFMFDKVKELLASTDESEEE